MRFKAFGLVTKRSFVTFIHPLNCSRTGNAKICVCGHAHKVNMQRDINEVEAFIFVYKKTKGGSSDAAGGRQFHCEPVRGFNSVYCYVAGTVPVNVHKLDPVTTPIQTEL